LLINGVSWLPVDSLPHALRQRVTDKTPTQVMNGVTLVPIKRFVEAHGGRVGWDSGAGAVIVECDEQVILFKALHSESFWASPSVKALEGRPLPQTEPRAAETGEGNEWEPPRLVDGVWVTSGVSDEVAKEYAAQQRQEDIEKAAAEEQKSQEVFQYTNRPDLAIYDEDGQLIGERLQTADDTLPVREYAFGDFEFLCPPDSAQAAANADLARTLNALDMEHDLRLGRGAIGNSGPGSLGGYAPLWDVDEAGRLFKWNLNPDYYNGRPVMGGRGMDASHNQPRPNDPYGISDPNLSPLDAYWRQQWEEGLLYEANPPSYSPGIYDGPGGLHYQNELGQRTGIDSFGQPYTSPIPGGHIDRLIQGIIDGSLPIMQGPHVWRDGRFVPAE